MVNLAALAQAHDFCTHLLDKGDANGYTDAIRLCRRAGKQYDPQGRFKSVPVALLKSTLVASDGNLQLEGERL
jgi:hypothetical protein